MHAIPYQPYTKGGELIIKADKDNKTLDLEADADQWGYNTGDDPVMLLWPNNEEIINSGTSFFIQPGIKHAFRNTSEKEGKIVLMQIKPGAGDPWKELALIYLNSGEKGVKRAREETEQWF